MNSLSRSTLTAALALGGAALLWAPTHARADDGLPAPPAAQGAAQQDTAQDAPQDARVGILPARTICEEKEVIDPPARCEQRVPRYETVHVPVYETHQVPIYETVEKPVYETREVPVFRTERTPVWGQKEVPTYRKVKKPVTIKLWRPFSCEDACIKLWDKCEEVPDGTKTVEAIVGHEERQVQAGTRLERHQVGTRSEQVLVGHRCERVKVGEREERRLAGYDTRMVVTAPACKKIVRTRKAVPSERVTIVPNGAIKTEPLAGTTRVLTEAQFQELLASDS